MTTIAIDGVSVAADGRRHWGPEILSDNACKLVLEPAMGKIFACAGAAAMFPMLMDWYVAGADPDKVPRAGIDPDWDLIVIDRFGVDLFNQKCPYAMKVAFPLHRPLAFGAGGDYAIGAMLAGVTARRAVELVASICPHTGGEIMDYCIEDVLGGRIKVAAE